MISRGINQRPKFAGLIFAMAAVICIVIAMSGNWYHMENDNDFFDVEVDYKLTKATTNFGSIDYDGDEDLGAVFGWTFAFVLIAMIATCAGLVMFALPLLLPLFGVGKLFNYAKIGKIVLAIGAIFAIVAPIYIAITFPDAAGIDSFWGKSGGNSWGAGVAWYFSLVSAICGIVAFASSWTTKLLFAPGSYGRHL